ncbi:VOC family protein [Carnobacterium mobile]|uniref:VOC family protein n=1 Tax=Carnobacterium mobile TaxID=2750 RepID=UPI001865B7BD|nr:VOC family protein [Carnobacterium mobile]
MEKSTRGIDHIGVTVPDIEQATLFFQKAFAAEVIYDNLAAADEPKSGQQVEQSLGLKPGTTEMRIRMLAVGNSANIELFQFGNVSQRQPVIASDYGLQHVAFYVDDIQKAVEQFTQSGGKLLSKSNKLSSAAESGFGNQFVYGRAPWGMLVEMISYPAGINYPADSQAKRWTPAQ